MGMPARTLFPSWSVHCLSSALTYFRCPVSNDTQRTKLHPDTDGPGWTSLAIFSKSGITRRETSGLTRGESPRSTFGLPNCFVLLVVRLKSFHLHRNFASCCQANLKMYTHALCFPTYLNVFCIIYLFSFRDRLSILSSLPDFDTPIPHCPPLHIYTIVPCHP